MQLRHICYRKPVSWRTGKYKAFQKQNGKTMYKNTDGKSYGQPVFLHKFILVLSWINAKRYLSLCVPHRKHDSWHTRAFVDKIGRTDLVTQL